MTRRAIVHFETASGRHAVELCGRPLWALWRLVEAGAEGCTPMSCPAPRWSAYVHKLRRLGIPIETVREAHDGPFAGHHARYVLAVSVRFEPVSDLEPAE